MLHYGDVEDDVDNPPIETLQEKSELKAGQNAKKPDWPQPPLTHFPRSRSQFP